MSLSQDVVCNQRVLPSVESTIGFIRQNRCYGKMREDYKKYLFDLMDAITAELDCSLKQLNFVSPWLSILPYYSNWQRNIIIMGIRERLICLLVPKT